MSEISDLVSRLVATLYPVESVWDKPRPKHYYPLKFTKRNQIELIDIERMLLGWMADLFPEHYVRLLALYAEQWFPRARIYFFVNDLVRDAEERYLKCNHFLGPIVSQWRKSTLDPNTSPKIGTNLNEWLESSQSFLVDCRKFAQIFLELASVLHIPKQALESPLRLRISVMYHLILDRIDVLTEFQEMLRQASVVMRHKDAHIMERFEGLLGDDPQESDED